MLVLIETFKQKYFTNIIIVNSIINFLRPYTVQASQTNVTMVNAIWKFQVTEVFIVIFFGVLFLGLVQLLPTESIKKISKKI